MPEGVTASSPWVRKEGKSSTGSSWGLASLLRVGQGCVHFPAGKTKGQQMRRKPLHTPLCLISEQERLLFEEYFKTDASTSTSSSTP